MVIKDGFQDDAEMNVRRQFCCKGNCSGCKMVLGYTMTLPASVTSVTNAFYMDAVRIETYGIRRREVTTTVVKRCHPF